MSKIVTEILRADLVIDDNIDLVPVSKDAAECTSSLFIQQIGLRQVQISQQRCT